MAERTPYFGIEYFVIGDYYSATVDKRRFSIIDQGMAFISDLIGPGVIEGWDISVDNSLSLRITAGWGMIGRNIAKTYGFYTRSLVDNNTYFVWMRGRNGITGQLSAFSAPATVAYIDIIPPSVPTNLSVIATTVNAIQINWSSNSDIDFAEFVIYRSTNNIDFVEIERTSNNSYTDANLLENTIYFYKIRSVDFSGNQSNFSTVLPAVTAVDSSKPADPGNVQISASKNVLYLTWVTAAFGAIANYRAYVTLIDIEGNALAETLIFETTADKVDMTLYNLENDKLYSVVLKSVTVHGIESDGIVKRSTPLDYVGPPDIIFITVEDVENATTQSKNSLYISWSTFDNPYENFDGYAEIVIEEYNSNDQIIISKPIAVTFGINNKLVSVFAYESNGTVFFKSIQARNTYYITVRNKDVDGNYSIGKRIRHVARNFAAPESPNNLTVTQNDDASLLFTFDNSQSFFVANYLRVTRITNSIESTLLEYKNIGRAAFYLLQKELVALNSSYKFYIYCDDEFGNQSQVVTFTYTPIINTDLAFTLPPRARIFVGDKENTLTWGDEQRGSIASYSVYRAFDASQLLPSSFSLIETLDGNQYTYTDYEVENNKSYVYFVVATNKTGLRSVNLYDSYGASQALVSGRPRSKSQLPLVQEFTASIIGNSVELLWQPTGGVFDGYEIYRSVGNKYSYKLIATVDYSTSYYFDQNCLIKTNNIYYIIRKYRNEAEPFITETNTSVTNATFIGKIQIQNGIVNIDKSLVTNISEFEDPIRTETRKSLASHTHSYYTDDDDRRIILNDIITVSNWSSVDNQSFVTSDDITQTTTQQVFINGQPVNSYNISYILDKTNGRITFDTKLAATGYEADDEVYPFDTVPTITVEVGGIEEVQGQLPNNRLRNLFGNQVTSGKFIKKQLSNINHDGRIREKLSPVQLDTINIDNGYRFALSNQNAEIGNAIVFYDILPISTDNVDLLASTSDGIYASTDYGNTWSKRYNITTPVSKFIYSEKYAAFFAATNSGFFFARGSTADELRDWREIVGAENTKVIRDIIIDNTGEVYCSSDLGVYRLRKSIGDNVFYLEQLPIFGPLSTDAYAMLYDSHANRILVSNSLGLFESYDQGNNWFFTDEFSEQKPIFSLLREDTYIFAITDFMVWRKSDNQAFFERIGVLENIDISRKIIVWNSRILITTDDGVYISSIHANIYSDANVTFEIAYPNMRIKNSRLPATSLNLINNKLFIGSENRLFISERPENFAIHFENNSFLMPTVYVNGLEQKIGYRFTTDGSSIGKYICFDIKQDINSVVTVANQYRTFKTQNGGWVRDNFISSVALYLNGQAQNEISLAERPASDLQAMILPTYNDRNAHAAGAAIAEILFQNAKNDLLLITVDADGAFESFKNFNKDYVVRTFTYLDKFLSQIYDNARIIEVTNDDGSTVTANFAPPEFRVVLLNKGENYNKNYLGSHGVYREWVNNNSDTVSPGSFGYELDATNRVDSRYISGTADLGIQGGGTNIAGGLLVADTSSDVPDTTNQTSQNINSVGG